MKDIKGDEIEVGDEVAYASYDYSAKLSVGIVTEVINVQFSLDDHDSSSVKIDRTHSSAYGFGRKYVYDEKTHESTWITIKSIAVVIGKQNRVVILKKHAA